jgi:hypothetical protein
MPEARARLRARVAGTSLEQLVKRPLTYSNVAATIALVVAISGGAYAVGAANGVTPPPTQLLAVIGHVVDVPTGDPDAVRIWKVSQFGALRMSGGSCSQSPGLVTATLNWKNTTTTSQRISFEREGSTTSSDVAGGAVGQVDQLIRFSSKDIFQGELRVSGFKFETMVMDVTVAIGGGAGQHCRVTVDSYVVENE